MAARGQKDYFEKYGHLSAPKPGEPGHRIGWKGKLVKGAWDGIEPRVLARELVKRALASMNDPDFYYAYMFGLTDDESWRGAFDDDMGESFLPDWLGIPFADGQAEPLDHQARVDMAVDLVHLTMEADSERWGGHVFPSRHEGLRPEGGALPAAYLAEILGDRLEYLALKDKKPQLMLVALSKKQAQDFVKEYHSKGGGRQPPGTLFAVGAAYGDKLVAVATAGAPTGRWGKDTRDRVLELTRIASGPLDPSVPKAEQKTVRGASSFLARRIAMILPFSSREEDALPFLVTYQLVTERGSTYRALADVGYRPVKFLPVKKRGGKRKGGEGKMALVPKIAWMCCPLPWEFGHADVPDADWSLLDMVVTDIEDFTPYCWLDTRIDFANRLLKFGFAEADAIAVAKMRTASELKAAAKQSDSLLRASYADYLE